MTSTDNSFQLHHVGYSVASIEEAAKAYIERFGYKQITDIIHDPIQTAFVQFFILEKDHVYLEFVAPDSAESKLTRTTKKGPSLNHLCYTVEDIDAATCGLRESGMMILTDPVPAVAFSGGKIAWFLGLDGIPIEIVERSAKLKLD